jgi:hypothetical protein
MMSNRWLLLGSAAIGLGLIAATLLRLNTAATAHDEEASRLRALQSDIATLKDLRATEASALSGEPPEDDLLGSVRETIRAAGLDSNAFARLSTSGESAVRGREGYARKSYRLELNGLDATDLGSFLSLWRDAEPLWTPPPPPPPVESIELRRQQTSRRGRDRSSDRAKAGYSVSMTLSTVYASGLGDGGNR